jgi:SAM-dependent methyltransferase
LAAIASTIILAVQDSDALVRFYEDAYSQAPEHALRYSRWRALGAIGKAEHVVNLCRRAGVGASTLLDVGCGDGALLSELHRRRFASRLVGVEITRAAVEIARARPEIAAVELFDGATLPFAPASFDLGVLSHVLEHVGDPPALLREVARTCQAVVVEVPLEANWSARRASRRAHAHEVGHLQRLDRAQARAIIAGAGLEVVAELEDPLPLRAHTFLAEGRGARAAATARWAFRAGMHAVAPPLARRAFTLHYACLCGPPGA